MLTNEKQKLNPEKGDIDRAIQALKEGLAECGYQKN